MLLSASSWQTHISLPYRSLEFEHKTFDCEWYQPVSVVNYPNEHAYTRVTEFKYLTGQKTEKTSVVFEYPKAEGEPYYPIPRAENAALYARYKELADREPNVHFVGRLATYKYYNMDQVVAQALVTFKKLSYREAEMNLQVWQQQESDEASALLEFPLQRTTLAEMP